MAQVIIFTGLQGSGKTSYFHAHFANTHTHVSRDLLGTAAREAALIKECLSSGRSLVIDNTNATRAGRAPLIQRAKAAGFAVHAYFFDTSTRTAIGRNNHRKDKKPIPVPAIIRTAKHLEPPSLQEGFDDVKIVKVEPDSRNPAE